VPPARRATARTPTTRLASPRPAQSISRLLPSPRSLLAGLALIGLAAGAYIGARETSVFAVRDIVIVGGSKPAFFTDRSAFIELDPQTGQKIGEPKTGLHRNHVYQAGNLAEAERLYQDALREDGGNAEVLYRVSVLNAQRGRFDVALQLAERALAVDPRVAQLHFHRAEVLAVVPVMLQRILQLPEETLAAYDLSALRITSLSGSALPGELATAWMDRFGDNVYNLYGSTEVASAEIA